MNQTEYKPDCNQTLVPVVDPRYPKQNFSVRKIRCENVFVLMMLGPIWICYDRLLIIWLILLLSTRCLSYSMGENVEHYHGIFAADLLKYFRLEHEPKRARMRDKPLRQKNRSTPNTPNYSRQASSPTTCPIIFDLDSSKSELLKPQR